MGTTGDRPVSPFVHEALFYSSVDEFLAGTLAFVSEGLSLNEPVLLAVPEPRLGLLRVALAAVVDRVRFVDMAEAGRNPNRILPWVLKAFVAEHHPRPVRIVGEPLYVGRAPEEIAPCVQHEALTNLAFEGVESALLCAYDVGQLAHVVPCAERTHPVLVSASGRHKSMNYTDPQTVVALLNQPLLEPKHVAESLVFDVHTLPMVQAVVAEFAGASALAPNKIADLSAAVNVIATNAVTDPNSGSATMRLWSDARRVVCEIRGAGEVLDPVAGRVMPGLDSPRGRGLHLANQLCDLVQTHIGPATTVTRLHMRLSPR